MLSTEHVQEQSEELQLQPGRLPQQLNQKIHKIEQNLPQDAMEGEQQPTANTIEVTPSGVHQSSLIGPPPAYQDIYPIQPHLWNGQMWPPPPPPPPPTPPSSSWPIQPRRMGYYHYHRQPRTNVHMVGGQVINPTRVPFAVRWFLGTITFMMIFSIVCALVYALIVITDFK